METNAYKTKKRSCVKSFRMDMQDELIIAMLEIDGIKDLNHVVEVKGSELKVGVVQMENDKVIGILGERFTIPGTQNAKLISKRVVDGILSIVIARKDWNKAAIQWPHVPRFKRQNELIRNAKVQLN